MQADFVLSVLAGTAGVATLYRGAVYRPQPAPLPAGPLVAPSGFDRIVLYRVAELPGREYPRP
ncbi:hypothetical protein [Streptomyces sp. WM4235]|uniref:hypothetical protein n=1 Tax=Streptomyces sp. WM4235 TaxID=1415551 RepID=UPI00131B8916|nr:hypothetical protein [Streptomyces sp. WM4235]